ncbi:C40 family peptidase [candidate division KSB1 bacterium]
MVKLLKCSWLSWFLAVIVFVILFNSIKGPGSALTSFSEKVVTRARSFIGTPYKYGGNSTDKGIDCSSLTQMVYGDVGINLPRTSREQSILGEKITNVSALMEGDLVFFIDGKSNYVNHVGIYAGKNTVVHSSRLQKKVVCEDLDAIPATFVFGRRLLVNSVQAPVVSKANPNTNSQIGLLLENDNIPVNSTVNQPLNASDLRAKAIHYLSEIIK